MPKSQNKTLEKSQLTQKCQQLCVCFMPHIPHKNPAISGTKCRFLDTLYRVCGLVV